MIPSNILTLIRLITFSIFIISVWIGFTIADQKPLWFDERLTQIETIQGSSYLGILLGKNPDTNKPPLFYVMQKKMMEILHYRFPYTDKLTLFDFTCDKKAQRLLRINPILFISLSMSLIFFFFANQFSLFWGFYAMFMFLTMPAPWGFWAEARPYALWIFLTVLQSILFLLLLNNPNRSKQIEWGLGIVNVLLSLTVIFSTIQIICISLVLWILKRRTLDSYIWLTLAALCINIFYWAIIVPRGFRLAFPYSFTSLIYSSVSKEQLFIFLSYIMVMLSENIKLNGRSRNQFFGKIKAGSFKDIYIYLIFFLSIFFTTCLALAFLKHYSTGTGYDNGVYHRYCTYLTPVSVLGVVFCAEYLVALAQHKKLVLVALIILLVCQGIFSYNRYVYYFFKVFVNMESGSSYMGYYSTHYVR